MIPSTAFLCAAAAFTFFASTAAKTYTSGTEFFNDLPQCIKDCNSALISSVETACASSTNNIQCVCQSLAASNSPSPTNSTSDACSGDDQDAANSAAVDFATQCVPYYTDNSTTDSAPMSAASTTAIPSGSGNATSNATVTRGTVAPTKNATTGITTTQSTGAAASLLFNSLFVIAVPVVLSGLFM